MIIILLSFSLLFSITMTSPANAKEKRSMERKMINSSKNNYDSAEWNCMYDEVALARQN